jgi:hypothetical protein
VPEAGVAKKHKRSAAEVSAYALNAAFARAAREQRELQRLRASGTPFACLDYHPELLGKSGNTTTPEESESV